MIALFAGGFILLAVSGALFLPEGVDWSWVVRPGCLALLRGESPYETVAYFGFPPWALLPFIPLALLPEAVGRGIVFALGLGGFAFSIWKLGGGTDRTAGISTLPARLAQPFKYQPGLDAYPGFYPPTLAGFVFHLGQAADGECGGGFLACRGLAGRRFSSGSACLCAVVCNTHTFVGYIWPLAGPFSGD